MEQSPLPVDRPIDGTGTTDPAIRTPLQIALNTLCITATEADCYEGARIRLDDAATLCRRAADRLDPPIEPPDNGDTKPS